MTASRLTPAGRRPLRVGGAVVQALRAELGTDDDPWAGLRRWASEHYVDEAALCGWERIADLGGLSGEERQAFLVVSLLLGAAVNGGSSALPLGAAPEFGELMAHIDEVGLPLGSTHHDKKNKYEKDALARGLASLQERCTTSPEVERVFGVGDEARPLVVDLDALYFHNLRTAEVAVADRIRVLLEREASVAAPATLGASLTAVLDATPLRVGQRTIDLAAGQVHAVAQALCSSLLVLTGGPGTGKTSIITQVLRAFAHAGVSPEDMLLAAPTGRAANRMKESIEQNLDSIDDPLESDKALRAQLPSARTLHRLLGYRWNQRTFKVNRDSPLAGRLLVVDEVSMVSLPMMRALLDAVPDEEPFTIVLVGDAHQLPSVETGDVLRELTRGDRGIGARQRATLRNATQAMGDGPSKAKLAGLLDPTTKDGGAEVDSGSLAAHTVWLTEVYRQADDKGGRHVAAVAAAMRDAPEGQAPQLDVTQRDSADAVEFNGVELFDWTSAEGGLDPLLSRYADVFLDDSAWASEVADGFDPDSSRLVDYVRHRGRSRILCFTHQGVAGEEAVNALVGRRLDPTRPPGTFAYPGAPVLVTENDDSVGLFNGDQGVVVRVKVPGRAPQLEAAFVSGDGVTLVPLGRLPRAKLCYAMTVHKSQGSEYDSVVLVLPKEKSRLLVRETVYTGLTRGRRGVVVVGPTERFGAALATGARRASRLRTRFGGAR